LRFQAAFFQRGTNTGCSTVLPNNGVVDRSSSCAVPDKGGLTLVGDAERGDLGGTRARFGQDALYDRHRALPKVFGVVLNPSGMRVILRKFLLLDGNDVEPFIEKNCSSGGRALVYGENLCRHVLPPH